MKRLINRTDIAKWKQIAESRNSEIIDQYIVDAQNVDLRDLICDTLFNELIQGLGTHDDLLNGSTYEYNGITYIHYGLKSVLAHFTYARYVYFGFGTDTSHNYVERTNEHSNPVSEKTRQTIYTFNRQNAMRFWDDVKKYMQRTDYKNSICCEKNKTFNGFRIEKII